MNSLDKDIIVLELVGSSGVYDNAICEQHGITQEQLEEVAEEHDVQRCEACGWWVESSECDEDGYCEDCHIE